jgi:integrase
MKLPREEPEEIQPQAAAHVEAVYRRIPAKHRLALLLLDWSGARVAAIDLTKVGHYDEPRRRVRLRAATTKTRRALWVELNPALAEAIEATLPHRRFRDPRGPPVRQLGRRRPAHGDSQGLQGGGHPAL